MVETHKEYICVYRGNRVYIDASGVREAHQKTSEYLKIPKDTQDEIRIYLLQDTING